MIIDLCMEIEVPPLEKEVPLLQLWTITFWSQIVEGPK